MAIKKFTSATKRRGGPKTLTFQFDDTELTARTITPEQMGVYLSVMDPEDEDAANQFTRLLELLRDVFTEESYEEVVGLLRRGEMTFEDLVGEDGDKGILMWLIEEGSDRPTTSPSGSSKPSAKSGKRSTGRAPGKGSTRSTSTSRAS